MGERPGGVGVGVGVFGSESFDMSAILDPAFASLSSSRNQGVYSESRDIFLMNYYA